MMVRARVALRMQLLPPKLPGRMMHQESRLPLPISPLCRLASSRHPNLRKCASRSRPPRTTPHSSISPNIPASNHHPICHSQCNSTITTLLTHHLHLVITLLAMAPRTTDTSQHTPHQPISPSPCKRYKVNLQSLPLRPPLFHSHLRLPTTGDLGRR